LSARFRRTAGQTRQLCIRSTPFHFNFGGRRCGSHLHFRSIAFRRPQTAETVKDSGAPKDSRGRDAPHIGQDLQYGRETSSGQQAIARDASHGQDTAIRREAPPVAGDKQYGRKASPGQDWH
jgi:hypothetical protein